MKKITVIFYTIALLTLSPWASAQEDEVKSPFVFQWQELAPGVWAGIREESLRTPVMGNAIIVISDKGAIVFDGGGSAPMAEQVMAKVTELTDKPITHIIISHWHGDHNFGLWKIVEKFPEVEVVAHSFTYAAAVGGLMNYVNNAHDAVARYAPVVDQFLETGLSEDGVTKLTERDIKYYQYFKANQDYLDSVYEQHTKIIPTLTFENKLTIYSGDRQIQILFLGAGNTEGDAVMWLPDERIVATGDLVVYPEPFAFNVYPEKWAESLRRLNDLNFKALVPGHGQVLHNRDYTTLMIEALDSVAQQAKQFVHDGLSYDEAMEKFDFSAFDERFSQGDPFIKRYYENYFVGPVADSAYRWATGEQLVVLKPNTLPQEEESEEGDSSGE